MNTDTTDHMTDEERERVAGLRDAAGKLRTAAEALATLGLSDLNLYGRGASDVLALAVSQLDGEAAAIPQRAVPIKIGDAVRITRPWDRRSTPCSGGDDVDGATVRSATSDALAGVLALWFGARSSGDHAEAEKLRLAAEGLDAGVKLLAGSS